MTYLIDPEWKKSSESHQVVGRVVEVDKVHWAESKAAGHEVTRRVPVMETKVLSSADVSHQVIKDWNRREVCNRFPGAWEAYEKAKASMAPVEPKAPAAPAPVSAGTPIDRASDFLPADKVAWLKTIGFTSLEQLADMSDAQIQDMGTGARQWRKKAKTLLATG